MASVRYRGNIDTRNCVGCRGLPTLNPATNQGDTMNTATCPGCGDTHLCLCTPARPVEAPLLDTLRLFIDATFEANPIAYVSSAGAYLAYLHWCTHSGTIPVSQRRFVPAMGELGYPRVKRSTMRFAGLEWRDPVYRGRHAAEEARGSLAAV